VGGELESVLWALGSAVVIQPLRSLGSWTSELIPFYGKITLMNFSF
jgi:hypothetical protein